MLRSGEAIWGIREEPPAQSAGDGGMGILIFAQTIKILKAPQEMGYFTSFQGLRGPLSHNTR